MLWGSTFVIVKQSVAEIPVTTFLALRFLLAAIALAAVFGRDVVRGWRTLAGPGLIVGLCLGGGYYFQTAGLQFTQASRAGFITGLSVVFVPVLSAVFLRLRPAPRVMAGVALALVGLCLLFLVPAGGVAAAPGSSLGDALVLTGALFFAFHITTLGRYSGTRVRTFRETGALATLQVGVAAIIYVASSAFQVLAGGPDVFLPAAAGPGRPLVPPAVVGALLLTGLLATAGAFFVQTAAQRHTPPNHTALILASEPVFAAAFGWLLLGERLGPLPLVGCLLILAGMVIAELPESKRQESVSQPLPGTPSD